MIPSLSAPFFEIGPKNLLRRAELEAVVRAAGIAGADFGVTVLVTVPTALIAPIVELRTGVRVYAQGMSTDGPGPSVGTVTAESLVDAGAAGVMLNHDSNPLDDETLALSVNRARSEGLETMVCVGTTGAALSAAPLAPTIVLYEPPDLIGVTGDGPRDWIADANAAVRGQYPAVLMMHAGGVATPQIAHSIMLAGADGTGSTSGVLNATDPGAASRLFIEAIRTGWDEAHAAPGTTSTHHHHKGEHA